MLRFDFTGLGMSGGDFSDSNFSSNVGDLLAAANYLRAQHQAPQLLIGHSLGGAAVLAAAHDIAEARAAYHAVKKSDRVVQIGTQRRSEGPYIAAAKQVQSGVLGTVTRIDISVNFHEPRWRRDYTQIKPEDVAWPQDQ